MKASKQAPEREFRYRLFTTPNVTCGPEVAEFITGTSGGVIQIEFVGGVSATLDGLSGPHKIDAVRIMQSEKLFADGFSVVLLNDDIAAPLFQWENYAVVSHGWQWVRRLELEGTDNPGIPILIYLTLTAVVNYELHKYLPDDFPHELIEQGPFGWASLILSGRLPFESLGKLKGLKESEQDVDVFLSAVESVLGAIAENHPSLHAVPSSEPDPRQQPPHEVKADFGMPIESSDGEPKSYFDQTLEFTKSISAWIMQRDLPAGVEITPEVQDVLLHSDVDHVARVEGALFSERPGAESDLITLVAECARPSAVRLLETMAAAGDPILAVPAQIALETLKNLDDPPPDARADDDSVTVTPDPISVVLSTNDPTVKITSAPPAPIGGKVAAATSEYDKPVDALGYRSYASALGDLITHSKTGTPLTIAVCGPWGSGKTTLMDYIKDHIKEVDKVSATKFIPLDFDAWKYSKSDAIWAPFYSSVLKGIESTLGLREKIGFRLSMRFRSEPAKTTGWVALLLVSLAIMGALLYMIFGAAPPTGNPEATELRQVVTVVENNRKLDSTATLIVREPKKEPSTFPSLKGWTLEGLAGVLISLFGIGTTVVKIFNSVSSGVLGKVKKSGKDLLPLAQEDVVKYVDNVNAWLEPRLKGGERKRFIVFVDDIDRVEPNKIMQMMEAIQLFLRTPGFVFVLCMDARVVRQAIGKHYIFMGKTHGDRAWWGHHYLEKIIQIPFYLPKINLEGMMSLKEKLFGDLVTRLNKRLSRNQQRNFLPMISAPSRHQILTRQI